jgi:hypothetical protein
MPLLSSRFFFLGIDLFYDVNPSINLLWYKVDSVLLELDVHVTVKIT